MAGQHTPKKGRSAKGLLAGQHKAFFCQASADPFIGPVTACWSMKSLKKQPQNYGAQSNTQPSILYCSNILFPAEIKSLNGYSLIHISLNNTFTFCSLSLNCKYVCSCCYVCGLSNFLLVSKINRMFSSFEYLNISIHL